VSTPWLSDGWFDLVVAEAAGLQGPPTLEGTVVVEVAGADGTVAGHAVFAAGRLTSGGAGAADGADLTVTLADADAREVLAGTLDPSVAFMQGRMKVAGDMGPLLDLLALAGTEDARARLGRVAERTGS
jgi:hypothetical protein